MKRGLWRFYGQLRTAVPNFGENFVGVAEASLSRCYFLFSEGRPKEDKKFLDSIDKNMSEVSFDIQIPFCFICVAQSRRSVAKERNTYCWKKCGISWDASDVYPKKMFEKYVFWKKDKIFSGNKKIYILEHLFRYFIIFCSK